MIQYRMKNNLILMDLKIKKQMIKVPLPLIIIIMIVVINQYRKNIWIYYIVKEHLTLILN
jgi:hypothetical protein